MCEHDLLFAMLTRAVNDVKNGPREARASALNWFRFKDNGQWGDPRFTFKDTCEYLAIEPGEAESYLKQIEVLAKQPVKYKR